MSTGLGIGYVSGKNADVGPGRARDSFPQQFGQVLGSNDFDEERFRVFLRGFSLTGYLSPPDGIPNC